MKRIVAINASPRTKWNTATLVGEAAKGAESQGAEVQHFDLYRLEKHSGCMSCFACKLAPNEGKCIFKDGLAPVLQAIREADGLIIGTPNYLGDATAEFRALYERLVFQGITYKVDPPRYETPAIPTLLIMTSNAAEEYYERLGMAATLENYQRTLSAFVGPTRVLIAGDTLQVKDYSRYDWTMFDPAAKQERHDTVFPQECEKARELGAQMAGEGW